MASEYRSAHEYGDIQVCKSFKNLDQDFRNLDINLSSDATDRESLCDFMKATETPKTSSQVSKSSDSVTSISTNSHIINYSVSNSQLKTTHKETNKQNSKNRA